MCIMFRGLEIDFCAQDKKVENCAYHAWQSFYRINFIQDERTNIISDEKQSCVHVNHKHGGGQQFSEQKCVFWQKWSSLYHKTRLKIYKNPGIKGKKKCQVFILKCDSRGRFARLMPYFAMGWREWEILVEKQY